MSGEELEYLNTPLEDLLVIIAERMPDKSRLYYHCQESGIIFRNKIGKEYFNPLIDWFKHTGSRTLDGDVLVGYEITSGMCKYHFELKMDEIKGAITCISK